MLIPLRVVEYSLTFVRVVLPSSPKCALFLDQYYFTNIVINVEFDSFCFTVQIKCTAILYLNPISAKEKTGLSELRYFVCLSVGFTKPFKNMR